MDLHNESSLQLSIEGVDNLDQILKISSLDIFIYGMRGVKNNKN
jgi:hypothetical protein